MEKIYETLRLEVQDGVAHLRLNNPGKANAMTRAFWGEMRTVMAELDRNEAVRVVVLSGEGKNFSAGLDLAMFADTQSQMNGKFDPARARENFRATVLEMQESFTAIERCRKPVLAAMHGACIGGAIDMASACDMRYCSEDAYFCVKEIDLAIVADVGTLQRLPKIIPEGIARELAYTGRNVSGQEAEQIHLVNRCYPSYAEMMAEVGKIAALIAEKSPIAMRGTKEILNYSRDHSVAEGLNYVATWNAAMIYSHDLLEVMQAGMEKRKPVFKNN
ncbi:MAG: crotonase/enoyl-CoA hydratase family protein [Microscillaceae bacterium]|nr:crotonase/enoyl-CoA hydratase family protein [Microscillaceae bacterium]